MEATIKKFNRSIYYWKPTIDYRKHPELYRIGRGEQGVLICEPYKSEILPHWKFKTPQDAKKSSNKIYKLFLHYLNNKEFVGADMARKFLQMGYTRSKRYANYKGGKKYKTNKKTFKKGSGDPIKKICSDIFLIKLNRAKNNAKYKKLKKMWINNLKFNTRPAD